MSPLRLAGVSPGKVFGGHFNADGYDHPSRAGDSFVIEPYELDGDSVCDLLALADTLAVFLTPRKEVVAA
jgi:hypothetical protein